MNTSARIPIKDNNELIIKELLEMKLKEIFDIYSKLEKSKQIIENDICYIYLKREIAYIDIDEYVDYLEKIDENTENNKEISIIQNKLFIHNVLYNQLLDKFYSLIKKVKEYKKKLRDNNTYYFEYDCNIKNSVRISQNNINVYFGELNYCFNPITELIDNTNFKINLF